ncbi:WD40 repeat-like protein [Rozella allomycis CSF55]|uniref:Pre-mRNA-processing factor 17 n=1 Tax=Rozella allomycis (strain CSF55) TaxID=988480 RepID=A0A075B2L6_ROZAC|nr:hypothetical protein O9G_004207 [Rozella allomycis CSF55]RKP20026.1 WD40 repeat-like protein [Rozella allomycis CSF55]|eukprot:EPZ35196.1 hypothetical protein O9G_004207 [Rozella allomycis CSF55]
MNSIAEYGSDEEQNTKVNKSITLIKSKVNIAPNVHIDNALTETIFPDRTATHIEHNVPYNALYKKPLGPANPNTGEAESIKNHLTGHIDTFTMKDYDFETQRLTYEAKGYALNPNNAYANESVVDTTTYVGDVEKAIASKGNFVNNPKTGTNTLKRKQTTKDLSDVDNWQGPWAGFEEDTNDRAHGYNEEEKEEFQRLTQKYGFRNVKKVEAEAESLPGKEYSIFHGTFHINLIVGKGEKEEKYLKVPTDIDVHLNGQPGQEQCAMPKKVIYTYMGHTKGVNQVRFFPKSGHILLSAGLDGRVKLWDVYHERKCLRTFIGHGKSVRDAAFTFDGKKILSASFDKYLKVWDTEVGKCLGQFSVDESVNCVKPFPTGDKGHLVLAGHGKKIMLWDLRTLRAAQEYDQHIAAVNSLAYIDENKRFVSVSDDKSIRVWEFDVPLCVKQIADSKMQVMPSVATHPSDDYFLVQSQDSQILPYTARGESFRVNRKKKLVGHYIAGYATQLNTSYDGKFVASGDAEGNLNIWDWSSGRLMSKIKGHEKASMSLDWHPQEPSKVATCSWDNTIKLWV